MRVMEFRAVVKTETLSDEELKELLLDAWKTFEEMTVSEGDLFESELSWEIDDA